MWMTLTVAEESRARSSGASTAAPACSVPSVARRILVKLREVSIARAFHSGTLARQGPSAAFIRVYRHVPPGPPAATNLPNVDWREPAVVDAVVHIEGGLASNPNHAIDLADRSHECFQTCLGLEVSGQVDDSTGYG